MNERMDELKDASTRFDFDEAALRQTENLQRIGRRRLYNQNDLDDFVQETLLRAYEKREQLRDPKKFDRWIAAIARNLAREWNRKKRELYTDALPELPDNKTPHDILMRNERRERLASAMGRSRPDDRDILRARYMEDASYEELQNRYNLSYSAVGFRLHRAKARLRKILGTTIAALIAAFGPFKRAAWGGVLFMSNTAKIAVGAAALACGLLIGGYLWMNAAEKPPAQPGLTLEQQSPRVARPDTQSAAHTQSAGGSAETPSEPGTADRASEAAVTSAAESDAPTAAAPIETDEEAEDAVSADEKAARDAYKAFQNAMGELDFRTARGMAKGQAYAILDTLVQAMDKGLEMKVQKAQSESATQSAPQDAFEYSDGELRVSSSLTQGSPTILRKHDGEWYVESIPFFASSSRTVRDEQGNVIEHQETPLAPITPDMLQQIDGLDSQ